MEEHIGRVPYTRLNTAEMVQNPTSSNLEIEVLKNSRLNAVVCNI